VVATPAAATLAEVAAAAAAMELAKAVASLALAKAETDPAWMRAVAVARERAVRVPATTAATPRSAAT